MTMSLGSLNTGDATPWLLDAADLLAQPDPGPTPWLVDGLIVDKAIIAAVGRWKTTKSYGMLSLAISIATGEAAFGRLAVPQPGPVVFICEESGRDAMWRRLDALCRGRAIEPERLRGVLHVAANARVKLDDEGWQRELISIGTTLAPRLFILDPLARMKHPGREENAQSGMAPVVEFLRELRETTRAAVAFVHHTGHNGDTMRGSSDLESVWETRLGWKREGTSPEVTIDSEHREAQAGAPVRYRIEWDSETRSMRFDLIEDDVIARVRAYLADHPEASANEVYDKLKGNRPAVLAAVKSIRDEGGTNVRYHLGTTSSATDPQGGTTDAPFRGLGTTTAEPPDEPVPTAGTNGHFEEIDAAYFDELLADLVDRGIA